MIKKIGAIFSLWLFSIAVFAAGTGSFTDTPAVTGKTDMSLAFLSQIFGTVGNVLNGGTGQMLGKIFYIFNCAILVVAGLWLGYTVLTLSLKAAQEGSFMGQNKNLAVTFLKIGLGFVLLVPIPSQISPSSPVSQISSSTGYSLLQDIVMKVVVEGVGLADSAWNYSLQYLQNGGSVWVRPEDSAGNPTKNNYIWSDDDVTAIMGKVQQNVTPQSLAPAQNVFANFICMFSSIDNQTIVNNNSSSTPNTGVAVSGTNQKINYDVIEDDDNFTFDFPGDGNSLNPGQKKCGAVSWNFVEPNPLPKQGSTTSDSDAGTGSVCSQNGTMSADCETSREALSSLINTIRPVAQQYYCSLHATSPSCLGVSTSDISTTIPTALSNSFFTYANLIMPAMTLKNDVHAQTTAFITEAEKEGWISAGRYYWDLMEIKTSDNGELKQYAPIVTDYWTVTNPTEVSDVQSAQNSINSDTSLAQALVAAYAEALSTGDAGSGTGSDGNHHNKIPSNTEVGDWLTSQIANGGHQALKDIKHKSTWDKLKDDFSKSLLGGFFSAGTSEVSKALSESFQSIASNMSSIYYLFKTGDGSQEGSLGSDPFLFIAKVGKHCINWAAEAWIDILTIAVTVFVAATWCGGGATNIGTALVGVFDWIRPMVMALAVAMWSMGFVLVYYVPMYPYMLFTFGVISWLIAVIEAMVAAPLVCLGLTHPEGHDFLGEAKQALMLLLGIFLRPVLMIIGLFAGMILAFVAFRIVIYSFSGFLPDLFGHAPALNAITINTPGGDIYNAGGYFVENLQNLGPSKYEDSVITFFTFPMTLVVFTYMIYQAATYSFSLIYALPDNILRWIGMSPTGQGVERQMAGEGRGMVSRFGESSGGKQGLGGLVGSGTASAGAALKDKNKEKSQPGVHLGSK